jgi:tetratricopeptide (TPR) repeat protein
MSPLSQVVPGADLLDQVEGIEQGLQQRKRLGALGVIALFISALEIAAALGVWGSPNFENFSEGWPFALGVLLLVGGLLLLGRARFWIRESRRPFRYTYSVGGFEALTPVGDEDFLVWLKEDLTEKLARRIKRLSRLDEKYTDGSDGVSRDSHIHVSGSIGARRGEGGKWTVEVLPWVRVGPPSAAATLALPVHFSLEDHPGSEPPDLSVDNYGKLFERVFFSIATELYERIREDVERKIALLPGRYLPAVAYFHEAEDYANSNTLDSYEAAAKLYERVIKLYDPLRDAPAQSLWGTARRVISSAVGTAMHFARLKLSGVFRRAGKVELLIARAHIGYANTLLYRRTLAGFSGRRLNPVFETGDVTRDALARLERLSRDVPGWRDAQFEAFVTRAFALSHLGSRPEALETLQTAKELDLRRAEIDAAYLLVAGDLEPRVLPSIELYRRAVEVKPDFEAAQFSLAQEIETLWRTRPQLETTVAEMAFAEYERVIRLNPGNIAAWANLGYMHWLLGDNASAARAFRRARDYKEVKRETFVSEMDYGLARIAAEEGNFAEAYTCYINAVSAQLAQGVSYNDAYTTYYFSSLTEALLSRFEEYESKAKRHWKNPGADQVTKTTERVRDSVLGFVLNDCAEAHFNYYMRCGDPDHLTEAEKRLRFAIDKLQSRYVMVYLNLYRLGQYLPEISSEECDGLVGRVSELAPTWPDGTFVLVRHEIQRMREAMSSADQRRLDAQAARTDAANLRAQADEKSSRARNERVRARRERSPVAASGSTASSSSPSGQPLEGHWAAEGGDGPGTPRQSSASELAKGEDARALDAVAKKQDALATRRIEEAEEHDRAAKRCDDDARARARSAKEHLRPLLVHGALWRTDRAGEHRFNWELFSGLEVLADYRWERELSDLDVRALCAWCETCVALQRAAQGADENESERFTAKQVRTLAEYIRVRFLESDPDVLRMLIETEPDEAEEPGAGRDPRLRMAEQISFWVEHEATYWGFTWVDEDYFDKEEIVGQLRSMAGRPDLPSYLEVLLFVALGDWLLSLERWGDGREAYDAARSRDAGRAKLVHPDAFYNRAIGSALWGMREYEAAIAKLRDGVDSSADGTPEAIVRGLMDRIDSREGFFSLRDWLDGERGAAALDGDEEKRMSYESALRGLSKGAYLPAIRRSLSEQVSFFIDRAAYVEPLVMEVDTEKVESWQPDLLDRLEREGLAEIQAVVDETTGFAPPEMRIHAAPNLEPHLYSVVIDGIPVADGPPESTFGEPYRDIVSHVAEVVTRQLENFVDATSVVRLVARWAGAEPERLALSKRVLADSDSVWRLAEVLRALLREGVPLHELGTILAVVARDGPGTADTHDLIEKVRQPLARVIANTARGRHRIELPEEALQMIVAGIRAENGERFLAMPIPQAYEVRQAIQNALGASTALMCVAVVPDASMRPFVREMVAECCPELLVLTPNEFSGRSRFDRTPVAR